MTGTKGEDLNGGETGGRLSGSCVNLHLHQGTAGKEKNCKKLPKIQEN